jgi:hypothetical protein
MPPTVPRRRIPPPESREPSSPRVRVRAVACARAHTARVQPPEDPYQRSTPATVPRTRSVHARSRSRRPRPEERRRQRHLPRGMRSGERSKRAPTRRRLTRFSSADHPATTAPVWVSKERERGALRKESRTEVRADRPKASLLPSQELARDLRDAPLRLDEVIAARSRTGSALTACVSSARQARRAGYRGLVSDEPMFAPGSAWRFFDRPSRPLGLRRSTAKPPAEEADPKPKPRPRPRRKTRPGGTPHPHPRAR